MSDFYRSSPKMAWLRLYRITNESTETESNYSGLNDCGTQYKRYTNLQLKEVYNYLLSVVNFSSSSSSGGVIINIIIND